MPGRSPVSSPFPSPPRSPNHKSTPIVASISARKGPPKLRVPSLSPHRTLRSLKSSSPRLDVWNRDLYSGRTGETSSSEASPTNNATRSKLPALVTFNPMSTSSAFGSQNDDHAATPHTGEPIQVPGDARCNVSSTIPRVPFPQPTSADPPTTADPPEATEEQRQEHSEPGLLLILEDLHRMDPHSLYFLKSLLTLWEQRTAPGYLVVVGTMQAAHGSEDRAAVALTSLQVRAQDAGALISLDTLPKIFARPFVAQRLGVDTVSDEEADTLWRLTDGNPFHLEQLVYALLASGAVDISPDKSSATVQTNALLSPASPLMSPAGSPLHINAPTVSAAFDCGSKQLLHLLRARMDNLDVVSSMAVKAGAVLGMTFEYSQLRRVFPLREHRFSLKSILKNLCDLRILRLSSSSSSQPTYSFLHTYMRETAYGTMLRSDRRRLHRQIAKDLSAQPLSAMPAATLCALLATHWEAAISDHGQDSTDDLVSALEALTDFACLSFHAQSFEQLNRTLNRVQDIIAEAPMYFRRIARVELDGQFLLAWGASYTNTISPERGRAAVLRAIELSRSLEMGMRAGQRKVLTSYESMVLEVNTLSYACSFMHTDLKRALAMTESVFTSGVDPCARALAFAYMSLFWGMSNLPHHDLSLEVLQTVLDLWPGASSADQTRGKGETLADWLVRVALSLPLLGPKEDNRLLVFGMGEPFGMIMFRAAMQRALSGSFTDAQRIFTKMTERMDLVECPVHEGFLSRAEVVHAVLYHFADGVALCVQNTDVIQKVAFMQRRHRVLEIAVELQAARGDMSWCRENAGASPNETEERLFDELIDLTNQGNYWAYTFYTTNFALTSKSWLKTAERQLAKWEKNEYAFMLPERLRLRAELELRKALWTPPPPPAAPMTPDSHADKEFFEPNEADSPRPPRLSVDSNAPKMIRKDSVLTVETLAGGDSEDGSSPVSRHDCWRATPPLSPHTDENRDGPPPYPDVPHAVLARDLDDATDRRIRDLFGVALSAALSSPSCQLWALHCTVSVVRYEQQRRLAATDEERSEWVRRLKEVAALVDVQDMPRTGILAEAEELAGVPLWD